MVVLVLLEIRLYCKMVLLKFCCWAKAHTALTAKGRQGTQSSYVKSLPFGVEVEGDVHYLVLVFGSFVDGDFPLVRRELAGDGVEEQPGDSPES